MEHLHNDPNDSGQAAGGTEEESLSAYVQRMETEENLRKLASKLKGELGVPARSASGPSSSGKSEEKQKRHEDQ